MTTSSSLTEKEIIHVAKLARLSLTVEQVKKFLSQLTSVVGYIQKIQKLDTTDVLETSQITGLENVFREDEVDEKRTLSQKQALANAKRTHKGYFVVDAVFNNKE